MKILSVLILASFVIHAHAIENKPYAGQQDRVIKSLSQHEINGLRKGKGMGLAKAAELNHYPGPLHVLDEAEKLSLTNEQLNKTRILF